MKPNLLLFLALSSTAFAADEKVITPTFDSVGLFKNGLAVVRVSFPAEGPGQYLWDKVPRAVHGTLWVESDGIVSVQSTTRMIDKTDDVEVASGNLQKDLAGKNVTVTLRKDSISDMATVTGRVWEVPTALPSKTWNADYSSLNSNNGSYYWYRNQTSPTPLTPPPSSVIVSFLVIEEEGGERRYISQADITAIQVNGPFKPASRQTEEAVLLFDVREAPAKGGVVRITYLTKGLAWLPSYQLDLTDPATLNLRQSAVIKNEMNDLVETELQLISGYPNVRFGSVDSPLWPGTALAAFFQQLDQSGNPGGGGGGGILSNQLAMSPSRAADGMAVMALPANAEEGNASDDIHYESVGKKSMKAGDSLSLEVAAATAKYERVVEWTVADPRDFWGRYQNQQTAENPAWDAVRFTNPFKFPMTTAPAIVMEQGKFRGQSLSEWVNPGQETTIPITRALSIRHESNETEEEGERAIVFIAGNDFQKTIVKGLLTVENFRNKEVTMSIKCEFSGKLLEAELEPKSSLRADGVYSVNPRRKLEWTVKLPAGEEKLIQYRYEVLVDR
ncbi:MAG: hypothetical protein H7Y36_09055 [Armatimonadetes bacterium]|nr:hypothetical protein [Akkermansiaceae bacterium]